MSDAANQPKQDLKGEKREKERKEREASGNRRGRGGSDGLWFLEDDVEKEGSRCYNSGGG